MDLNLITRKLLTSHDKVTVLKESNEFLEQNKNIANEFWNINELPFIILQKITESFYHLNTPEFTDEMSNNVKICIDVLKILVADPKVTASFLDAKMDYFIYPFLMASANEDLIISTLGLFKNLFKDGFPITMKGSEILPLLLKIVDSDSEVCQLIALQTMELILVGVGLDYAVQTIDRFQAIDVVLSGLLTKPITSKNRNLVKILLKIYCRLCDKPNVYQKLKEKTPEGLESQEMVKMCAEDNEIKELRMNSFYRNSNTNKYL